MKKIFFLILNISLMADVCITINENIIAGDYERAVKLSYANIKKCKNANVFLKNIHTLPQNDLSPKEQKSLVKALFFLENEIYQKRNLTNYWRLVRLQTIEENFIID